jgi:hypothetical protein
LREEKRARERARSRNGMQDNLGFNKIVKKSGLLIKEGKGANIIITSSLLVCWFAGLLMAKILFKDELTQNWIRDFLFQNIQRSGRASRTDAGVF